MKSSLPLLAFAFVVGCGPDVGPTNPEDRVEVLENELASAKDLFPAETGNAWTYTLRQTERNAEGQGGQTTGTPTLKVTGVNGDKVTVAFVESDKTVSELLFTVTEEGLVQRGIRSAGSPERTYNPPIPVYRWPMEQGVKRDWKGTGFRPGIGSTGPMESSMEYKGVSEVDTPAGRMKAYRFDTVTKYKQGERELGTTQSVWLVPKIGIVRNIEITITPTRIRETELKLQSYTVK